MPSSPTQIAIPIRSVRRERSILLNVVGHAFRVVLLVGAIVTVSAVCLTWDERLAEAATDWLRNRLTRPPEALLQKFESEIAARDLNAALGTAERFFASLPPPHPADAYGGKYRRVLRLQIRAAEELGNLSVRLRAGERAMAFDARDSWLLFRFGAALRDAGKFDRASEVLRAAFAIRPNAPQILQALESLPNLNPTALAELRQRHYEALALCMTLPTWMSGNLVAPGPITQAFAIHLSVDRETLLHEEVNNSPTGFYMVLPKVAELEVKIVSARFIPSKGDPVVLIVGTQGALTPLSDGFYRITAAPDTEFDTPTVIGFAPPTVLPPSGRIEVIVQSRPSMPVAAHYRLFGTWQHSGVKANISD